ncbi:PASTA domain-containing protein [Actinomadura madurae]|nr:hypothetical protein [Actinomadura madurae]MCP9979518.1 hypothetical protein [Actinomadura madurae]
MDEDVADAVNHVLRGVLTKGTARGMGLGRDAAGKTGTVDNFSAAWFAGYTPDLAAAVWVGDPRGGYKHPMESLCMDGRCYGAVFGATIPAPIWRQSMLGALSGTAPSSFHRPPSRYFSRGSGEDRAKVPDVRGMRLRDAIARLRAAGFRAAWARRSRPAATSGAPSPRCHPGRAPRSRATRSCCGSARGRGAATPAAVPGPAAVAAVAAGSSRRPRPAPPRPGRRTRPSRRPRDPCHCADLRGRVIVRPPG